MAKAALKGPTPGIVTAAALSERWGIDAARTPLRELTTMTAVLRIWQLVTAHRGALRSGAPRIALRKKLKKGLISTADYEVLDELLRDGMVTDG